MAALALSQHDGQRWKYSWTLVASIRIGRIDPTQGTAEDDSQGDAKGHITERAAECRPKGNAKANAEAPSFWGDLFSVLSLLHDADYATTASFVRGLEPRLAQPSLNVSGKPRLFQG